jgi:Amt family ammonium transporter
MHPVGAFVVGGVAGVMFVYAFTLTQNRLRIDDVLGVWPLHGLAGAWGGIACGVFGSTAMGGMGGVSFMAQLAGTFFGIAVALVGGLVIYGLLKWLLGIRLSEEDEYLGADLSIHKIGANSDEDMSR